MASKQSENVESDNRKACPDCGDGGKQAGWTDLGSSCLVVGPGHGRVHRVLLVLLVALPVTNTPPCLTDSHQQRYKRQRANTLTMTLQEMASQFQLYHETETEWRVG